MILAASSPFFKKVLKKVPHNHPVIYLKGVKFSSLEAVLSFVYCGEVLLAQADLEDFLAVAKELEVKGLTEESSNYEPQPNVLRPFAQSAAPVSLQTPLKTEQDGSASENRNASGAVLAKR